ncbi:MAG: hypothetical protein DRQ48_06070 [Gammaproteobacteria bacterium]|nr:MAG: hypothetical protein DRQ48_06070 [Gammaproteobacteria bacterium]
MEGRPQNSEDLRNSERYKTNNLPVNLISKDSFDNSVRLSNVSSGGLQILCSHHAAQQLSTPKYSPDGPINIVAEILGNDNSSTFMLVCKVVYIQQNYSANDCCPDAVGMEALTDNHVNKLLLRRFIERIT